MPVLSLFIKLQQISYCSKTQMEGEDNVTTYQPVLE